MITLKWSTKVTKLKFVLSVITHIKGQGCPKCVGKNMTTDDFINKAKTVHGDKYDYSEVDYKGIETKVIIKCNKCNSLFYQTPHEHLAGCGCPECNASKGEEKIKDFLNKNNINYIHDKSCLNFLGQLRPDFYLPDYNTIIEFDGIQHFEAVSIFGGEEGLKATKERDNRKKLLCEEHNIELIRISYDKINEIDNILNHSLIR